MSRKETPRGYPDTSRKDGEKCGLRRPARGGEWGCVGGEKRHPRSTRRSSRDPTRSASESERAKTLSSRVPSLPACPGPRVGLASSRSAAASPPGWQQLLRATESHGSREKRARARPRCSRTRLHHSWMNPFPPPPTPLRGQAPWSLSHEAQRSPVRRRSPQGAAMEVAL